MVGSASIAGWPRDDRLRSDLGMHPFSPLLERRSRAVSLVSRLNSGGMSPYRWLLLRFRCVRLESRPSRAHGHLMPTLTQNQQE